jgi:hypothetical protein
MDFCTSVGVDFAEAEQNIAHDVRVGILVYGDPGGGMRAVHDAKTVDDVAFAQGFPNLRGNVVRILALGFQCEFAEHVRLPFRSFEVIRQPDSWSSGAFQSRKRRDIFSDIRFFRRAVSSASTA